MPSRVIRFILLIIPTAFTYGFIRIWISAYLAEIGFSNTGVGLLLGVNGAALVLGAIPLSLIADRRGKKTILLAGLLAIPPTGALFALTTDFGILVVAAVLTGIEEGAFFSTWNALIADQTDPENRDAAFALSFMVSGAAMGLGYMLPFAFPPLEASVGASSAAVHSAAMLAVAALAVVSPLGLHALLRGYRDPPRAPRRSSRSQDLRLNLNPVIPAHLKISPYSSFRNEFREATLSSFSQYGERVDTMAGNFSAAVNLDRWSNAQGFAACFGVTAAILAAVLVLGTAAAAGAPFVQGVSIDVHPDEGVADITAVITSDSPVVSAQLSYSADENATFGPPVSMTRTGADVVTGTYTFTYRLSWTLTSIRVMVVAEDSNGTLSDPFVTSHSWSVTSGTQPMAGGGTGAIVVAALVATGTTVGIIGLRRFLRGRAP